VVCIDPSLLVAVKICGVSKLQTSTAYRDLFYFLSLAPSLHFPFARLYWNPFLWSIRFHSTPWKCWTARTFHLSILRVFGGPFNSCQRAEVLGRIIHTLRQSLRLFHLFDNPDNPSSTRASARESIATVFDRRGKRKLAATSSDDEDFAVADVMQ
jgi:hypothetical protein